MASIRQRVSIGPNSPTFLTSFDRLKSQRNPVRAKEGMRDSFATMRGFSGWPRLRTRSKPSIHATLSCCASVHVKLVLRCQVSSAAKNTCRAGPSGRLGKGEASKHSFVGLNVRWKGLPHEQWMIALGATRFAFRSSSIEAIVEAVRRGAGIAALLEKDPQNADLIRINTDITGPAQPVYLVYHRDLRSAPHVRAAVASIETYIRTVR